MKSPKPRWEESRIRYSRLAALLALALLITLPISPRLVHALATHVAAFIVNSTADTSDANPGDGACADGAGACTLRAAIEETNARAGADTITGSTSDDTLEGKGGSDTISGGAGADNVFGDDGDDILSGDAGDDYVDGGVDTAIAPADNDTADGGAGDGDICVAAVASNCEL